ETIEARLSAALSSLAEAVTIQRAEGALIYANEAAARMLGFDTPQDVVAEPVADIVGRFVSVLEDGRPMTLDDLPGRKLLLGEEEVDPLVVRSVDKATGQEHWRVTKATPIRDREGRVELVVNIIEDITEVKRAEMAQ